MKERLDQMADEIGESRSIVIRSLLREAMDEQDDETDTPPFAVLMGFIGWFLAAAAFLDASEFVGFTGLGMVVVGVAFEKLA